MFQQWPAACQALARNFHFTVYGKKNASAKVSDSVSSRLSMPVFFLGCSVYGINVSGIWKERKELDYQSSGFMDTFFYKENFSGVMNCHNRSCIDFSNTALTGTYLNDSFKLC